MEIGWWSDSGLDGLWSLSFETTAKAVKMESKRLLSWVSGGLNCAPSFDGRKGDNDNALAALTFQFEALATDFGDKLTAFAAGFRSIIDGL